ncbi:MAG: hypothetical protein HY645_12270 [Acidobacteria bacterium]|nr:hypothetical protein [Acidobacteriota bacterium]
MKACEPRKFFTEPIALDRLVQGNPGCPNPMKLLRVRTHRSRTAHVSLLEVQNKILFLKDGLRTGWREYLNSYWAGFGLVCRSRREWEALKMLHGAQVSPEPLFLKTCGRRALLAVSGVKNGIDLHHCFSRMGSFEPSLLSQLAHGIGRTLAVVHSAGLVHRGLHPHHILVDQNTGSIRFIDFQRARRRSAWHSRLTDLVRIERNLLRLSLASAQRREFLSAYFSHVLPPCHPQLRLWITRWVRRRAG